MPADYLSVNHTKAEFTHCAPHVLVADFQSSKCSSSTLQANGSLSASWASDADILAVDAVVSPHAGLATTVYQSILSSSAVQVVQPNPSITVRKSAVQSNSSYRPQQQNNINNKCEVTYYIGYQNRKNLLLTKSELEKKIISFRPFKIANKRTIWLCYFALYLYP